MRGHSRARPSLPWEPVVQEGAGTGGERCRGEASHGAGARGWLCGARERARQQRFRHEEAVPARGDAAVALGWAGQDEPPEGLGPTVAAVMGKNSRSVSHFFLWFVVLFLLGKN